MKEITETEALHRMASFCAASEHCRAEVVEKLQRWGIDYQAIERIANRLEADNFIDDERFCQAFIHDKYRMNKWGKRKIAQALQLKKIPSYTYQRLLNEIDADEYREVLSALLTQKRKSIHADTDYERDGKLIRFALSRGFEMDDIRHCMDVSGDWDEENVDMD